MYYPDPFYTSKEWRKLRNKVLIDDKWECQICKTKGVYTRANHVHHIFHREKYPEYALSKYVTMPDGKVVRNLISVCKNCHETVCHPERLRHNKKIPLNEERW